MDEYNYDVFISYKRSNLIEPWVTNYFLETFKEWLTEKLLELEEPEPRIFFDKKNIEAGMIWPNELRDALKTSKILVAICSPSYFYSHWCKSEWGTFLERETMLGRTLRIPVRHNDCEKFLADIAWSDFYGLTFPVKEFYQSIHAVQFHTKIEALAQIVANAIHNAPPYNPQWPVMTIPSSEAYIPMKKI